MGVLQAVATLPYSTDEPSDVTQLTFWFASPTKTAQELADEAYVYGKLVDFFNGLRPTVQVDTVAEYLSPVIKRTANACTIEYRELFGNQTLSTPLTAEPDTFTLAAAGSGSTYGFPNEVAICLSYNATAPGSPAVPAPSRRGRLYIGPLGVISAGTANASEIRPAAQFLGDIASAGRYLAERSSDADGNWVVYSRKLNAFSVIDEGWVDNAWDTQRRREIAATSRQLWAV